MAQGQKTPLVSVIVPAYNVERFIGTTLDSILEQTYPNLEVVVVDDGSTDATARIIRQYAARDPRIVPIRQQNLGVAAARNTAIAHAQGAYIAPTDADDILFPDKIRRQVECLRQAPASVGLVYVWSVNITQDGCLTGGYMASDIRGDVYEALIYQNFIGNASTPLISRACLDKVGLYDADLHRQGGQGCEDWDLYLRIAERYQVELVPAFLVGYRQMEGSMSCNIAAMQRSYELVMRRVRERGQRLSPVLLRWSRSLFHNYMALQAARSGDHWRALLQLQQALRYDIGLLADRQFYGMCRRTIVRLAAGALGRRGASPQGKQAGAPRRQVSLAEIERSYRHGLAGRGQTRMELVRKWADSGAGLWSGRGPVEPAS